MKSIQLLTRRTWLLALAEREKSEALRLAHASSGFGGIAYSCDYYVDCVMRAQSRERHYLALAKLGAAALRRLDDTPREILERKYLRHQSCEEVAAALGMKLRSFYRRKDEALSAFDYQVRKLLSGRRTSAKSCG